MSIGRVLPLCWFCKHLILDHEFQKENDTFGCTAFPEGIPEEIGGGEYGYWFDHRAPHPDDHGIQFEPGDVEDLKYRLPFRRGDGSTIEDSLNDAYDYLDYVNADRAEHPDDE